jgi:hypothetical protein
MKRHKMGGKASRKLFKRTAVKTNRRNVAGSVMRGGIRL